MALPIPITDRASGNCGGVSPRFQTHTSVIGSVKKADINSGDIGVFVRTKIGGKRVVGPMYGEGLPRIC